MFNKLAKAFGIEFIGGEPTGQLVLVSNPVVKQAKIEGGSKRSIAAVQGGLGTSYS